MIETIIALFFEFVVYEFLYRTAKVVLPLISFKKVLAREREKIGFWDFPQVEVKDGAVHLGFDSSICFGILFWGIVVLILFALL